jgi:hypothetical protein
MPGGSAATWIARDQDVAHRRIHVAGADDTERPGLDANRALAPMRIAATLFEVAAPPPAGASAPPRDCYCLS